MRRSVSSWGSDRSPYGAPRNTRSSRRAGRSEARNGTWPARPQLEQTMSCMLWARVAAARPWRGGGNRATLRLMAAKTLLRIRNSCSPAVHTNGFPHSAADHVLVRQRNCHSRAPRRKSYAGESSVYSPARAARRLPRRPFRSGRGYGAEQSSRLVVRAGREEKRVGRTELLGRRCPNCRPTGRRSRAIFPVPSRSSPRCSNRPFAISS